MRNSAQSRCRAWLAGVSSLAAHDSSKLDLLRRRAVATQQTGRMYTEHPPIDALSAEIHMDDLTVLIRDPRVRSVRRIWTPAPLNAHWLMGGMSPVTIIQTEALAWTANLVWADNVVRGQ